MKFYKGKAGFQLRFLPGEFGNVSKKLTVFRDFALAERGELTVTGSVADKKRAADNVRCEKYHAGSPEDIRLNPLEGRDLTISEIAAY